MKKKILALSLFSLLATGCATSEPASKVYDFNFSFDASMGNVVSNVEKGKHEEGTQITLTSTCLEGFAFVGYYDSASEEIISSELTYTFNLVKDTNLEVRFNKEDVIVNDETLGVLKGNFNSGVGTLNISNDKITLAGEKLSFDYKYNKIKDEDLTSNEGKVLYFGENDLYRLYLNNIEFKQVVLEAKNEGTYEEVATFMPSIEEFSGAYFSPLSENDPYDPSYTSIFIGNEFDSDREIYLANNSFISNQFNNLNSFFFTSGYTLFEGKLTKTINQYDYADETLMGLFILGSDEGGSFLKPVNEDFSLFKTATAPFNVKYWNESGKLEFALVKGKNETTLDGVTYSISYAHDEKGILYTLTNGENKRSFRVTPLGIEEITSSGNVFYAIDGNEKYINGEFTSGDYKVKVDIENTKVTLNGQESTFKYVLKEKRKAIEVTFEGKTYTIFAFKDDTSDNYVIRLVEEGNDHYLVNKDIYKGLFVGTHISKEFTKKETITIDENLTFTFNNSTKPVELEYEVKSDSAYIEFNDEKETYKFYLEDEALGAFVLSSESGEQYFLPEKQFERFKGEYTSKIVPNLAFEGDKLKFDGKTYDYRVDLVFEAKKFANYVNLTISEGAINTTFVVDSLGTIVEYKGTTNDGALNFTTTYIKQEDANSLIGRYSLLTKYGEENFEFKEDGTLYVDQLNVNGSDIQENVKKEFTLSYSSFNGKAVPTINFKHNNMIIFLRKDGESLVTFDNYYVKDYIYRFNGYYSNSEHALRLYQNTLTLDGTSYVIESSKKNDKKTTIISGNTEFIFDSTTDKKVTVKQGESSYDLSLSSFDPTKLNGATLEDSGTTYSVVTNENKTTGIKEVVLSDGFMTYKGKYVIHEGKEALEFSVMFDTLHAYLDGDKATLTKDSGGLLPPPPPPLPF